MTDKEKVLAVHPDAQCLYCGGFCEKAILYDVESGTGGTALGHGPTEELAWADAASKLPKQEPQGYTKSTVGDYGVIQSEVELLPCPFCGGVESDLHGVNSVWVECHNNQCPVQPMSISCATSTKAIAAWNTRALANMKSEDANGK